HTAHLTLKEERSRSAGTLHAVTDPRKAGPVGGATRLADMTAGADRTGGTDGRHFSLSTRARGGACAATTARRGRAPAASASAPRRARSTARQPFDGPDVKRSGFLVRVEAVRAKVDARAGVLRGA